MEEAPAPPERKQGVVKWFNAVKGFGFVTPAEGEEDLFVHQVCSALHGAMPSALPNAKRARLRRATSSRRAFAACEKGRQWNTRWKQAQMAGLRLFKLQVQMGLHPR